MKNSMFKVIIVALGIFCIKCSYKKDSEWTQFRGINASGVSSIKCDPPIEFNENKNLKWKVNIPVGSSSPVVWGNKMFLTAYEEDEMNLLTISLDRTNGEILWSDTIAPEKFEKPHAIGNPASSTPAVDKDGLYVYFSSFGIRCFTHDGKIKWEYPLPVPEKVMYGHPSSPVIMDDKLILSRDFGDNQSRCLLAFNKNTGDIVWKSLIQENTPINNYGLPGYSTPIKYNEQVILHRSGGIASYSLLDGSPIWWYPIRTNGISTPVIYNDVVYVSAWMELSEAERRGGFFNYNTFEKVLNDLDQNKDGLISKSEIPDDLMIFSRPEINDINNTQISLKFMFNGIDKDKDGLINEEEWMSRYNMMSNFVKDFGMLAIPLGLKGEISNNDIIWTELEKIPEVPSPLAYHDCIYMVKNGGWLTCMDAKSGQIYYQEKLGSAGAYIASPIISNNKIFIASYNGSIKVIEAGEDPSVISETKLKGKITASPAILKNNIYIRTSEYLYDFSK